jgi:hypothetical protein
VFSWFLRLGYFDFLKVRKRAVIKAIGKLAAIRVAPDKDEGILPWFSSPWLRAGVAWAKYMCYLGNM